MPTHRVNHRRELDEAARCEAGCGGCPAACTQALTAAGGRRRHAACSDGTERARVSSRSLRWRVAASARCDHCKRHLIEELLEKKEKGEDERDVGGQGVDWTTAWHALREDTACGHKTDTRLVSEEASPAGLTDI